MENNQPNREPVSATENITNGHSHPTSASKTSQPTPHANDSLGQIGAGVRVLMHAINDLARHGIDNTIPLPKIVVIGNQSAGKSSLIEAIRLRTKLNDNATTWLTLPVRSKCLGMWVHARGFVLLSRHLEIPILTIFSALCKSPSQTTSQTTHRGNATSPFKSGTHAQRQSLPNRTTAKRSNNIHSFHGWSCPVPRLHDSILSAIRMISKVSYVPHSWPLFTLMRIRRRLSVSTSPPAKSQSSFLPT